MQQKKPQDDFYSQPSRHKQWQEHASNPTMVKPMDKSQIEELRQNLVGSYNCDNADITVVFERIIDENDEDRDDCLMLKYVFRYIHRGKIQYKDVFSIKVPIPEDIKLLAEQRKKEQKDKMEQLNAINRLAAGSQLGANNQLNMTTHTSMPMSETNTVAIPIIPHNPIITAPVPINTTNTAPISTVSINPAITTNQVITIPTATPKPKTRKVVVKPKK
jgi:hypothetical protein